MPARASRTRPPGTGRTSGLPGGRCAFAAAALAGLLVAAASRGGEIRWAREEFSRRFIVERAVPPPRHPARRESLPVDLVPVPEACELVLPGELGGPGDPPGLFVAEEGGPAVRSSLRFDEGPRRWVLAFPAVRERVVVYYAPDGEADAMGLPFRFGRRGVHLATYRLTGSDGQRHQLYLSDVVKEARSGLKPCGSGPRRLIDDAENPFGSNDDYLAVYQGWLLAPRKGRYRLALDADDAGFLLVDGLPAVSFGGRPHTMAGNWRRQKKMDLEARFYHVAVYGRERRGAQGVRLAWAPADDRKWRRPFSIIPPRAFPGTIPARIVRSETRPGREAVDFRWECVEQLAIPGPPAAGRERRMAARVKLVKTGTRSRTSWAVSGREPVTAEAGEAATAYVPAGTEVPITLATAGGSVTRSIRVGEWEGASELKMSMRVTELAPLLYEDDALSIGVEAVNSSAQPVTLVFDSSLPGSSPVRMDLEGKPPVERRRTPGRAATTVVRVPPGTLGHGGRVRLRLGLPGVPIVRETVLVLGSRKPWPDLKADLDGLRAPGGERVVLLVPRERESDYRAWAPLKGLGAAIAARGRGTLVYGDDLAAGGAGGLTAALKEAGSGAGPFRHAPFAPSEVTALGAVAGVDAAASGAERRCVLSVGRGDVSAQTPVHTFSWAIDAAIDRLRRAGVARIVVVGPVPEVGRLEQSGRYNRAAAKCAAGHHVAYVDLHKLLASGRGWRRNFAREGERGLTSPYPNAGAVARAAGAVAEEL